MSSHVSFQGTTPLATACTAIDTPSRIITAEDASGSQRVTSGPRSSKRATRRRAYTISMPIAISTSGQTEAEGHDQEQPESDPAERERAQQHDQRRGARHDPAGDAESKSCAQRDHAVLVVVMVPARGRERAHGRERGRGVVVAVVGVIVVVRVIVPGGACP